MSVTNLTNGTAVSDATISRDGKYIVYHEVADDSVRMWLQQTGQTGRVEIITLPEISIGAKTFAPGGEFVYFLGREGKDTQPSLYRVPTLGGLVTKILADINSPVSFSPDGRLISFVRQNEKTKEYRLVTTDPDGADEKVLLTRVSPDAMSGNTAWSPDGKYIAYQSMDLRSVNDGPCSIAAINVETLDSKALSAERWDNCYRMAWTNDGRGLVFIGTRSGESLTTRRDQIYYVSVADGISRRISTDGNRHMAGSFGLTADGELLVVPHKRFSQIWVMNSDGNSASAEQLTNGQRDGTAGIAPLPDGRVGYVSRVGENLTIWIMNADGSNQQQIGSQIAFLEELRATPDGRFFIFSGQRDGFSHLYRIDTDGQNLVQLTDGKSYEIDSAISPDSHWVYYDSTDISGPEWKASLRKTSVDNSQTIELRPLETTGIVPDISPDGKLILGLTRGGGLTTFSTADGSQLNHFRTDKFAELGPGAKWTRDGQFFTYLVNRKDSMNIWVQPLHGPQARPLTHFPKGYIYSYAFSRDGTKLYIARGYQTLDAVLIRNF
jgi:Tol biopolymer transport system component